MPPDPKEVQKQVNEELVQKRKEAKDEFDPNVIEKIIAENE